MSVDASAIFAPATGIPCCGCAAKAALLEELSLTQSLWNPTVRVRFGCVGSCSACAWTPSGATGNLVERDMYLPAALWKSVRRVYSMQATKAGEATNTLHRAVTNYLTSREHCGDEVGNAMLQEALLMWLPAAANQVSGNSTYARSAETILGSATDSVVSTATYGLSGLLTLGQYPVSVKVYGVQRAAEVEFGSVEVVDNGSLGHGKKTWTKLETQVSEKFTYSERQSSWYESIFGTSEEEFPKQYTVQPGKDGVRYTCKSGWDLKVGPDELDDVAFRDFLNGESLAYEALSDSLATVQASFPEGAYVQRGTTCKRAKGYDLVMTNKGPQAVLGLGDGEPVIARRVGPDFTRVQSFAPTVAAVSNGLKRRYVDTHVALTAGRKTKASLRQFTQSVMDKVFTTEAIEAWRSTPGNDLMSNLKSPNMSVEKFEQTLDELFLAMDVDLDRVKSVMIKREVCPDKATDGKPRLILNDGAENQLAALLTAKCIEDLWFHATGHHIKHKRREEALTEFIKETQSLGSSVCHLGGDGSSWDFRITPELRDLIENPIFDRVCSHLHAHVNDDTLNDAAHKFSRGKKNPRLKVRVDADETRAKNGPFKTSAFADFTHVRRSGDRLTSTFNQITNCLMWHWVLFEDPMAALFNPKDRHVLALRNGDGNKVESLLKSARMGSRFEGDDSGMSFQFFDSEGKEINSADPPIKDHIKAVFRKGPEQLWRAMGFSMKFEWAFKGEKFTFIGVDLLAGDRGLANCYIPEVLRSLGTVAWSTCPEVIQNGPDTEKTAEIVYASFMARAAAFAAYPPLSHLFEAMASPYARRRFAHADACTMLRRDTAWKLGKHQGDLVNLEHHVDSVREFLECSGQCDIDDVRRLISVSAGPVTLEEEAILMSLDNLHRDEPWAGNLLPDSWKHRLRPMLHAYHA